MNRLKKKQKINSKENNLCNIIQLWSSFNFLKCVNQLLTSKFVYTAEKSL